MKITSGLLFFVLSLPPHAAERNPFIPSVLPCETLLKQLDAWRLHGMVHLASGSIALMGRSQQHWRRIQEGQVLVPGARISAMTAQQLTASLEGKCEGRYYHWSLPGGMDDKTYRRRRTGAITAGVPGGGNRHAYAG